MFVGGWVEREVCERGYGEDGRWKGREGEREEGARARAMGARAKNANRRTLFRATVSLHLAKTPASANANGWLPPLEAVGGP